MGILPFAFRQRGVSPSVALAVYRAYQTACCRCERVTLDALIRVGFSNICLYGAYLTHNSYAVLRSCSLHAVI